MSLTSALAGVTNSLESILTPLAGLATQGIGIAQQFGALPNVQQVSAQQFSLAGGAGGTFAPSPSSQGPGATVTGFPLSTLQVGTLGAELQEFAAGAITSPFKATCLGASAAPQMHLQINPRTGAATWFRPAGKPILWSSDLTACKRVGKIAKRAKRSKR